MKMKTISRQDSQDLQDFTGFFCLPLILSLLLILSSVGQAATVTGYFTDGASNAVNTVLVWRGVSVTYGIGTSNVVFQSRFNMPVTNGVPTNNANIQGGLYYVFNPAQNVTVPVLVPTNNATYQFGTLITNLPSFSIWNYINATNVIVAGDTNLSVSVNLTNGPTWTITLTNLPRSLVLAALGFTPVASNNASITGGLGFQPATNGAPAIGTLGFQPATNSTAGIVGGLGYTPPTNTYAALTNIAGVFATNGGPITSAQITTGLGYTPLTNSYRALTNAAGFVLATNVVGLNTNLAYLNGTTNPSTAYITNGIFQRTSTP
jgi:hypothetical protein